jgi:hypothetical protein
MRAAGVVHLTQQMVVGERAAAERAASRVQQIPVAVAEELKRVLVYQAVPVS